MSDGGLGDTLKLWNEEYFNKQGLFVHMELSESAMKNPGQQSKTFRKPAMWYSSREDRSRKEEERKFVIVVTKLDEDGQPTEAIQELEGTDAAPVELAGSGDPSHSVAELPGDEGAVPVELPAEISYGAEKKFEPPTGYIEMDSDNTLLMEKIHLDERAENSPADSEKGLVPEPLSVTSSSPQAFNKDMT